MGDGEMRRKLRHCERCRAALRELSASAGTANDQLRKHLGRETVGALAPGRISSFHSRERAFWMQSAGASVQSNQTAWEVKYYIQRKL